MIIIIIDDVDRIIVYKSAKIVQVEKSKIQIRSTTMKNYSDESSSKELTIGVSF
mgnify:CR=1 FL=1